MRDIPSHATAVGVPAKIIGRTDESDPAEDMDNLLHHVTMLGRKPSTITTAASTLSTYSVSEEVSSIDSGSNNEDHSGMDHEDLGRSRKMSRAVRFVDRKELQGPPRMTDGDEFCPFREYTEVAQRGTPKGTVNIIPLAIVLHEEGVPQCAVGLCFFEMDHKGRGFISLRTFLNDGPEVLSRNCGFSMDKSAALVQKAASLVNE